MALLHAGKAHRRSKREGLFKGTAALIAIAIISFFSLLAGTSWNRISCQSSVKQETSSTDLVVQVIRSITILAERSRRLQLRLDKSSGDADAPGEVFQLDGVYLSSVPRVVRPTLDGRMQASVPLTIWQSVPNHDGNSLAMSTLFNSWTVQHPEWDHFLFDEGEMSVYVENHFGPDVADLYWSMPFDRMRAEAFRCAGRLQNCPSYPGQASHTPCTQYFSSQPRTGSSTVDSVIIFGRRLSLRHNRQY